ncbi:MAG: Multidrug transporter substrate-binding protein [Devosia sp.]|uniref:ABC transporter permease n=1 Tax=Devosia sp. TaxID=1871048 RepID=UPI00260ED263|nr:ABC transporter permease [Devosia sp.]MDB5540247.1 Multidrug transporter substrate-binding protein [Devosia sp.]
MTDGAADPGPFSRFEFMVAGRYLRARRRDRFVSVIAGLTLTGIALGVAALIVVTSVMNGFNAEIVAKLLGLNGHFSAYPIEARFTDYDQSAFQIQSVDGVVAAIPYVEGQALASGAKADSTGVIVRGVSLGSIEKLKLLHDGAILGHWDGWDDGNGVAIGKRLAEKLKVNIGDPVTLLTPDTEGAQGGNRPRTRSYRVQVIFDLGMTEFDSFYLYMPLRAAQDYLDMFERVLRPDAKVPAVDATEEEREAAYDRIYRATAIEIFIADPGAIDSMRLKIGQQIERPLILSDWRQQHQNFFDALQTQGTVMFVILSMIIVVAAFNIISSLIMLVKDKGTDIAVLRTMGATRGAIMRIFGIAGVAIGVGGTLIGLALGLVIAANAEPIRAFLSSLLGITIFPPEVFFLSSLPSRTNPSEVAMIVAVALGLSFLATLYPAWRAAQYDPVEALRYE